MIPFEPAGGDPPGKEPRTWQRIPFLTVLQVVPRGSVEEAIPLARPILSIHPLPRARRRAVVDAITDFLIHLRLDRGCSANTLRAYQRDLRSFCRFLADRGADPHVTSPQAIMRPDVRSYLTHLASERSLRTSSIARHLACLRSFFRFLRQDGSWRLAHDPTEGISHPRVIRQAPSLLSAEELERLLAASERCSPFPRRDRCALALLATTGCRVNELLALRLADVSGDRILLRAGAPRPCSAQLSAAASDALRRYLQEERPQLAAGGRLAHDAPHGPLFLNARGTSLSSGSVERIFRRARLAAGIERPISLGALRRSGIHDRGSAPLGTGPNGRSAT